MMTTEEFLAHWQKVVPAGLLVHPDDAPALKSENHYLALDTLVGPFMGPVRTASVILLTLNGGVSGIEAIIAKEEEEREWFRRNLGGDEPLPDFSRNPGGQKWLARILKQFDLSRDTAANRVAFVNLIPYRSREGAKDAHIVKALPSSRLALSWIHRTIIPEAREGRRVLVCLRSPQDWGLSSPRERGILLGESFFIPKVNRGAIMLHGEFREKVKEAVRSALSR
jgi:hypothetical protein